MRSQAIFNRLKMSALWGTYVCPKFHENGNELSSRKTSLNRKKTIALKSSLGLTIANSHIEW